MENREDIPRVSVGSVQDWKKVRSNYEAAAASKLLELLVLHNAADERDTVTAYLEQFIEITFRLAQPNLRVNGHNFESLDAGGRDMELFDETLDRRIWSLADTRLQWHKRIAETRRSIPTEIESTVSTLLSQHRELDNADFSVLVDDSWDEQSIPGENDIHQRRIEEVLQSTSALAYELTQTLSRQQERGHKVQSTTAEVKSLTP
ncbi:hypothetical protein BDN70DRAFT_971890 [Pholiota conissans]|uniref:Uncharacterized protein n=1 Tax=Pholiota conissans TaxID=109636 RepID=A0A9P6CSL2_9AGAR|nr:hypothetical protein BDN70DRAFT_971890 [Pholiota conissans]